MDCFRVLRAALWLKMWSKQNEGREIQLKSPSLKFSTVLSKIGVVYKYTATFRSVVHHMGQGQHLLIEGIIPALSRANQLKMYVLSVMKAT